MIVSRQMSYDGPLDIYVWKNIGLEGIFRLWTSFEFVLGSFSFSYIFLSIFTFLYINITVTSLSSEQIFEDTSILILRKYEKLVDYKSGKNNYSSTTFF